MGGWWAQPSLLRGGGDGLVGVEVGEAAELAMFPAAAVPGVAGDDGDSEGGFAIDHLLVGGIDLAPARGFLERRAAQGAVADVGDGDLNGVLVHLGIVVLA